MLRPSQVLRLVRSSRQVSGRQHVQSCWRLSRSCTISRRPTSSLSSSQSNLISESITTENRQRDEPLQQQQQRLFHSTRFAAKDEESKKGEATSTPDESPPPSQEKEDDDDPCPEWQNPLHHNNPDYNKHFAEDFGDGEEMVPLPLPPFEEEPGKTLAPPHIHDLAHRIVHLTLLEMKELTTRIADHFGFDDEMMAASYAAGAGAGMAAGGGAGAAKEEPKEEKTIFELKLNGFDAKAKIKVIKEVRAITGLGLKEAKELVESAPKVVQKDLKKDKAEELKAQLEGIGAEVEIV